MSLPAYEIAAASAAAAEGRPAWIKLRSERGRPIGSIVNPNHLAHHSNEMLLARFRPYQQPELGERPPANPLRFSEPPRPRFPDFTIPRDLRNRIGSYLRSLRLECNLSPSDVPRVLRLSVFPRTIASWESGGQRPWQVYVDRLTALAGYQLDQRFVEGMRERFAPWTLPQPDEAASSQVSVAPAEAPLHAAPAAARPRVARVMPRYINKHILFQPYDPTLESQRRVS